MAYTRGSSSNIIVGAAALFTYEGGELKDSTIDPVTEVETLGALPAYVDNLSYRETLTDHTVTVNSQTIKPFRNVGYTSNGLEIQFQPDFGEVQVDQILDVAKLYKQGMQVNLNTSFAESTLENLLFAIAGSKDDLTTLDADNAVTGLAQDSKVLNMASGQLGECPVERGLVAVGPGTGDCNPAEQVERVYVAYRALSIESVTVSAKRDEATSFEVSFRLLPNNSGSYGKIVDRVIPAA